jgi:hypothetical protein
MPILQVSGDTIGPDISVDLPGRRDRPWTRSRRPAIRLEAWLDGYRERYIKKLENSLKAPYDLIA